MAVPGPAGVCVDGGEGFAGIHMPVDTSRPGISRIGRGALVKNSLLGQSVEIGPNAVVNEAVLGNQTAIADYSRL